MKMKVQVVGIAIALLAGLFGCASSVPEDQQGQALLAIHQKYPSFEKDVQQLIKKQRPSYSGQEYYDFKKGDFENIVIVTYGMRGADWKEQFNPFNFNNTHTESLSYSLSVNLRTKQVTPVK